MQNQDYLDFNETVTYLKTTSSTLYKWLQAGKLPAHKLGRQWRFSRSELDAHLFSQTKTSTENLSKKIIWEAYDLGVRTIHISPMRGDYEISYRSHQGAHSVTTMTVEQFKDMNQYFSKQINSLDNKNENSNYRIFLKRDSEEIQIKYHSIDTVVGLKVTMTLWNPEKDVMPLEKICGSDPTALNKFKDMSKRRQGLIIVTGQSGSGKTSTVYSLLNEFNQKRNIVFTLEDKVQMIVQGIQQVEFNYKNKSQLTNVIEEIYNSDPDVICFGLTSMAGFEDVIFTEAAKIVQSGHVVVLQMNFATVDQAIQNFKKHSDIQLDERSFIGAVSQKLVSRAGKIVAEYQFSDI